MDQTFHINTVPSGVSAIVVLAVLWGLFVTIYWMVVGWRAMRAHEKIADSAENWYYLAKRKAETKLGE
ncbi:MAG: hypothetical protein JXB10_04410 [Pirellulales bacterium]|nr:hypothetical protein [Pirellulales bacterium]